MNQASHGNRPERLLRLSAVEDRVGLKKSKLYELIAKDKFPRPIKFTSVNVWPESRIEAWIAEIVAASAVDQRG
ncbi:helix-turn-helix transcriptional regulator [Sphingopyxis sp. PET50]|uniref:helix-turn-helix transcriptional regulator n=1 Tax=Sphingopyxis sp. PET50 TaxID=2976533 RepID=UPI0021AE7813|nr:AlpA family phage regulatory protein [Sphingopyxis sp. PET50]